MAKRIQRSRAKGWRKPDNAVIVSRPSKWGNPYTIKPVGMTEWAVYEWDEFIGKARSRKVALRQCLDFYRMWAQLQIDADPHWLEPLRGKDLACWCALSEPCHADVLLEHLSKLETSIDAAPTR